MVQFEPILVGRLHVLLCVCFFVRLFRELIEEDNLSRFSMSMNNDDGLVSTASPSSSSTNATNPPSNVTSRPDETNGDSFLPRNESFVSATTAGIVIASVVIVVAGMIGAVRAVGQTLREGHDENRVSMNDAAGDLSEYDDWQFRSSNNMSSRVLAACRPAMRV